MEDDVPAPNGSVSYVQKAAPLGCTVNIPTAAYLPVHTPSGAKVELGTSVSTVRPTDVTGAAVTSAMSPGIGDVDAGPSATCVTGGPATELRWDPPHEHIANDVSTPSPIRQVPMINESCPTEA